MGWFPFFLLKSLSVALILSLKRLSRRLKDSDVFYNGTPCVIVGWDSGSVRTHPSPTEVNGVTKVLVGRITSPRPHTRSRTPGPPTGLFPSDCPQGVGESLFFQILATSLPETTEGVRGCRTFFLRTHLMRPLSRKWKTFKSFPGTMEENKKFPLTTG